MRIILICITGIFFMGISLSGCTIYRIDVQQGNVLEQETVENLQIGMTKQQVQFVLGTPIIKDPFHPERWDYVHILSRGENRYSERAITIFFKDGKLFKIDDSDQKYLEIKPESDAKPADS